MYIYIYIHTRVVRATCEQGSQQPYPTLIYTILLYIYIYIYMYYIESYYACYI